MVKIAMTTINTHPLQPVNSPLSKLMNTLSWVLVEPQWSDDDVKYMTQALMLAKKGSSLGEVPVGAVLVFKGKVIGTGFNQPISAHDPTAHAEIVALREACLNQQNYRLPLIDTRGTSRQGELRDTILYVTLEPCTMCMGALIHARLGRLVFAAKEPRAGMVGSQMNLAQQPFYNHRIEVQSGLLMQQSRQMLKDFFRERRQKNKKIAAEQPLNQANKHHQN